MKFVVIGGDAAGMSAASRAKRNQPDIEVTVLEQTEDVSYSACGMPYNIANPSRELDDLVVRSVKEFRDNGIDLKTGHRAEIIEPSLKMVSGKTAIGDSFKLSYDKLLIATGASPTIPKLPGFDLPGVLTLKNLEDGRKIKNFISSNNVKSAVIIGMGSIALEMCEALRERKIDVVMVKSRPGLLPWMNEKLSEMVSEELKANKIVIYDGHEILSIQKTKDGLKVVCADMELDSQMVIAAIGVTPNSELAKSAGLAVNPDRSIAVDKTLLTSDQNIYAAGDCADAYNVITGKKVWVPLALRANRAGWAVADNVTGSKTELEGIAGTAVFKMFDLQVARTGLTVSEAKAAGFDPADVVITSRSRAHSHPGNTTIAVHMIGDRRSGRLLGVQMVGKEGTAHRIDAPAVALHSKMTVKEFSECDLAYAPPFSPVWDPMLTAANQLSKKM
ncbi:MAG: FAD-dependent oxidoreductase [Spirochaetes bacterium]|nr:FAD-dependent oxidoreductase [Spirochaetota bacterium]